MTRPADAWIQTGRPMHDHRTWIETTDMPPAFRREVEAEYAKKEAEITARLLDQNARDTLGWRDNFDAYTAALDELASAYDELREKSVDGRVSADKYDSELVRLDMRRRTLETRAEEHERDAERIERVAADPIATYDDLLARFPALPRPEFSFVPFRSL